MNEKTYERIATLSQKAIKKEKLVLTDLQAVPITERNKKKTLAETVTKPGKTYTISTAYDLNGETVTLPPNVTLQFKDGGSISNGTLIGRNTIIHADRKVFSKLSVQGTYDCPGNVAWFADGNEVIENQWGIYVEDRTDQSADLQYALNSSFRELHFPPKPYYIAHTLEIWREQTLILHGSAMKLSMEQIGAGMRNNTIIFSDLDITLLRIAVCESYQNAITIEGGSFDVSLCENYTQNCIEVWADKAGYRIWGLVINTNVKGKYAHTGGVGININPVENDQLTSKEAYVTNIRINSNISNFGIGIKATNYRGQTGYYNWCTDLRIDGSISNCPCAIDTNVEDADLRATLQAGYYFDSLNNGQPLIRYTGPFRASIACPIYDLQTPGIKFKPDGSPAETIYSNQYALEITRPEAIVTSYGPFRSYYLTSLKMKKPSVKGTINE